MAQTDWTAHLAREDQRANQDRPVLGVNEDVRGVVGEEREEKRENRVNLVLMELTEWTAYLG